MNGLRSLWYRWRIRRMLKLTVEERLERITRVSRRRHRLRRVLRFWLRG